MSKMYTFLVLTAVTAIVLPCLLQFMSVWQLVNWSLVVFFSIVGFGLGVAMVICSGKNYAPKKSMEKSVTNQLLSKMMEMRKSFQACKKTTVTTMNLDLAIQEIMDLTQRDFVMSWYSDLGQDQERFSHLLQDEMWEVYGNLTERLQKIDLVYFMTRDVVNIWSRHFQLIRTASRKVDSSSPRPKFRLHSWLHSSEGELEYVRKLSEVCLIYLLPEKYTRCKIARRLFREILACSVIQPTVNRLCDPDYINQKVYGWLDYREQIALEHKRTFTYAATYEDFMKIIEQCVDIEPLRQMRYNIISEIMQATTIQNLKRAKGLDIDSETAPKGTSKGDLLRARNLKRYLNQLTVTKSYCEKRIYLLGGPDYKSYAEDGQTVEENIPGKKVLSFSLIMDSKEPRTNFMKYLRRKNQDMLLRFWISVEGMRLSSQRHWHQQAGEVYQMFITHPSSIVRLHLERSTIRSMESFMIGNKGPDAFWEAQKQISTVLEEQHYPSFILSDIYHKYISSMEGGQIDPSSTTEKDEDSINPLLSGGSHTPSEDTPATARIAEHSTFAQKRLGDLNEKISNKTQALHALRQSSKTDTKMVKLQEEIRLEIEQFKTSRREMEFHIERTDMWLANLGRWKAHIYNAETLEEGGKMVPYFVIVVDLPGAAHTLPPGAKTAQGWVVSRNLDNFQALHRQLTQIQPILKGRQLPTTGKFRVKSLDSDFLNKSKGTLQNYLDEVLRDESLAHSESAFIFFSPSPEYLKQPEMHRNKAKSSFSKLFKNAPVKPQTDSESEDELLFGDEESTVREKQRDSIAAPLYRWIMEVFEMRGAAKWLRRTLMAFVQVTFGRSTNRQLRETVDWMFSEPMLIYYLHMFRDSFWPDGKLSESLPPRSDEEKVHTRRMAKDKMLQNIPDAVKNLVGDQNAKKGVVKMFESLQDERLNKQLFYDLLEVFMYELYPELEEFQKEIVEERVAESRDTLPDSEPENSQEEGESHSPIYQHKQ